MPITRKSSALARLQTCLDSIHYHPMSQTIRSVTTELAGLLIPRQCLVCQRQDALTSEVCTGCTPELTRSLARPFRSEDQAEALPLRMDTGQPLPVIAAAEYTDNVAAALLGFKDHGRVRAAQVFHSAVFRSLQIAREQLAENRPVNIVPIPGSRSGFRRRGYDPVTNLLAGLPKNQPIYWKAIRHRSWVDASRSHTGNTSSSHRRKAAEGKFRLGRNASLLRGPILLFDDVLTTGSTLAAASRVLESEGFQVIGAFTVAAVRA